MTISIQTFTLLCILYFVVAHIGLYKLFEKAGIPGWKILIPFYGTWVMIKFIEKPITWLICYYIPFVGFVVWMGILVEVVKHFGKFSFKEHFLAVVFPGIYLTYLGYQDDLEFIGHEKVKETKKSSTREWIDAIVFAVVAASIIRGLYVEAFTIPTSSMELTLDRGDYLFVNKLEYGSRIPMTPLTFPFTHHTMFLTKTTPSYLTWFKFPYFRFPAFGKIHRNDCVVFNFPAGDTVALEKSDQSYYQLVRNEGWQAVHNQYHIIHRPVDKEDDYIKRCVAVAGDSLQVIHSVLYINGKPAAKHKEMQYRYIVKVKNQGFNQQKMYDLGITQGRFEDTFDPQNNTYRMFLTAASVQKLKEFSNVVSITRVDLPKGTYFPGQKLPVFPHDPQYNWSRDNFGPIWIPKKGVTITLTLKNLPLYKTIIKKYEHNSLKVVGNKIYINGKITNHYTFKQNYYWMMGDNRDNSLDSRYWGFVPHDHIVGKAWLIWFSLDPNQKLFHGKIRWSRIFKTIH